MANKGPNTNTSQFFITFRPCAHLDRKHTIFGKVVGGLPTLQKIEMTKTDGKDKPLEPIEILDTQVFVDPYEEADKAIKDERAAASKISAQSASASGLQKSNKDKKPVEFRQGIGKYISTSRPSPGQMYVEKIEGDNETDDLTNAVITGSGADNEPKKKKMKTSGFGNFSGW